VDDRRVPWVALNAAVYGHPRSARIVLRTFAEVEEVFAAGPEGLAGLGIREDVARRLADPGVLGEARGELEKLEKKAYSIMTFEDAAYPPLLREIYDPPLVLYVSGRAEALAGPAIGMVGARRPTAYGRAMARRLAGDLASRGLVVVSGFARGIDTCAHAGALEAGGRTVAVLGSGLDDIYPPENRSLAEKVGETGAVVTELPLGTAPLGFHFPLRNRIIAGLGTGLVVVEASRHSGSLITARLALEENREVMAVPGNVTSGLSEGTNGLIRWGARLVEDWEDVAEGLPAPLRDEVLARRASDDEPKPGLIGAEAAVLAAVPADAEVHIDALAERTDLSVSELLGTLLGLELKGLVVQGPGKNFQRRM